MSFTCTDDRQNSEVMLSSFVQEQSSRTMIWCWKQCDFAYSTMNSCYSCLHTVGPFNYLALS